MLERETPEVKACKKAKTRMVSQETYTEQAQSQSQERACHEGTREPAELRKKPLQRRAKTVKKLRQAIHSVPGAESHPGSGGQQRRLREGDRGLVTELPGRHAFIRSMLETLETVQTAEIFSQH